MQPKKETSEVKKGYVSYDSKCPKMQDGRHKWFWDGHVNTCIACQAKTTQRVLCD
jgi:hypothetical protein